MCADGLSDRELHAFFELEHIILRELGIHTFSPKSYVPYSLQSVLPQLKRFRVALVEWSNGEGSKREASPRTNPSSQLRPGRSHLSWSSSSTMESCKSMDEETWLPWRNPTNTLFSLALFPDQLVGEHTDSLKRTKFTYKAE